MNPNDFDLTQTARVYGIANTPPFLVRKLQADPIVHAISEQCSAQQILDGLRSALNSDPLSPVEAVRPYAYIVALWLKPEMEHLQEAAKIPAPSYRWFATIVEILVQTFSPIENQSIDVPGLFSAPIVSVGTSAPTTAPPTIIIARN
jgi:hypothetical protein